MYNNDDDKRKINIEVEINGNPNIIQTAQTINIGSVSDSGLVQNAKSITNIFPNNKPQINVDALKKKLKDFYLRNSTIKIPIFDKDQHVKYSYVNLAIVDNQSQNQLVQHKLKNSIAAGRGGTLEQENLALLGRNQTYEDINKVKDPIDIARLFDNSPRAVVIGRAGIGKSTFCKFIAYKWQDEENPYWPQFTTMYWLPLRYLANYAFKHDHAGEDELACFIVHALKKLKNTTENLSGTLAVEPIEIKAQLSKEGHSTLFILDGYDEIKGFINGNSPAQQRAKELLDYILNEAKHYLITSRPHAVAQGTFSRVNYKSYYELMGFTNADIPNYIA